MVLENYKKPTSTTPDLNQVAFSVVSQATGTPIQKSIISQVMTEMGRRGGLKGGKARAQALSASERTSIAKKAAQCRWKKTNH
jgi:hypothetical protein